MAHNTTGGAMDYPTNSDDVIDSRDVIEAIATLRDDPDDAGMGPEYLASLEELAEECADYVEDWQYGATLIRDSYFKSYAMELAEEIGAIPTEYTWPQSCIDWDQAARELRMDYTSVDFDGVTYWVR